MILLDSNIIINSTKPGFDFLRHFLANQTLCVSVVSYVEVLGYHKLTGQDKDEFEEFFALTPIFPVSREVASAAVRLRQSRKITLGDSLIAATAITHDLKLATFNTKDFEWISELTFIDPLTDT